MPDRIIDATVSIGVAIVGVAILAVLVSKNAQTPQVIQAATGGFATDLAAAVSPVTGQSISGGFGNTLGLNTSYGL